MTSAIRKISEFTQILAPTDSWKNTANSSILAGLIALAETQPNVFHAFFVEPDLVASGPDSEWRIAVSTKGKIDAIKMYRQLHGVGLGEAKVAVEKWMERTGTAAYQGPW